MIARHVDELFVIAHAEHAGVLNVGKRWIVIAQLKFAKPDQRPGSAVLGVIAQEIAQGLARFAVAVAVIKDRTEIPPAFNPLGIQLQRLIVQPYGIFKASGFARRIGLLGKLVELGLLLRGWRFVCRRRRRFLL